VERERERTEPAGIGLGDSGVGLVDGGVVGVQLEDGGVGPRRRRRWARGRRRGGRLARRRRRWASGTVALGNISLAAQYQLRERVRVPAG
jgi:hypothetical protein